MLIGLVLHYLEIKLGMSSNETEIDAENDKNSNK